MPRLPKNHDASSREVNQAERFKEAARALDCDESEERFDATLRKVAARKPPSEPLAPTKKSKTKQPAK